MYNRDSHKHKYSTTALYMWVTKSCLQSIHILPSSKNAISYLYVKEIYLYQIVTKNIVTFFIESIQL